MKNFTRIAHDDHDLTDAHVHLVMNSPQIADYDDGAFVLTVVPLPVDVDSLPCALYGPEAGDPPVSEDVVTHEVRNNRAGPSRLIHKPHRLARNMVVIGIKGDVCFTAYGSRATSPSPMEPWDAERKHKDDPEQVSADEVKRAREFWAVHALAKVAGIEATIEDA